MDHSCDVDFEPEDSCQSAGLGDCAKSDISCRSAVSADSARFADSAISAPHAEGFSDLGYAKVDSDRERRQGVGEVVFGEGKTAEQIAGIIRALSQAGQKRILITRLAPAKAEKLTMILKELAADESTPDKAGQHREADANPKQRFSYFESASIGIWGGFPERSGNGRIVIVAAGTSDVSVAEEAALTAEFLGNEVSRIYDVGVAGIHRLLSFQDELASSQVVIAVAGMEGALASVVGGLVPCPVIAVPTSIGYGASFGGVAALLAMLNSCASGVSVVNIDNGFGAAYQASLINHLSAH